MHSHGVGYVEGYQVDGTVVVNRDSTTEVTTNGGTSIILCDYCTSAGIVNAFSYKGQVLVTSSCDV